MKFKVIHKTKIRTKPSKVEGEEAGEINPGFVFDVVEEVEGQKVDGNNKWLKDQNGFFYWSGGVEEKVVRHNMNNLNELTHKIHNYSKLPKIPKYILSTKGKDTVIAIVDTGISPHPALENKVIHTYDAITNQYSTPVNDISGSGHGTFIAGLIASNDNTIKGVAPNSKLIIVKVANKDNEVASLEMLNALKWLNEKCPVKPDIINISLDFYWGNNDRKKKFDALFSPLFVVPSLRTKHDVL